MRRKLTRARALEPNLRNVGSWDARANDHALRKSGGTTPTGLAWVTPAASIGTFSENTNARFQLGASGGVRGLHYTVSAGALPSGMALNSHGMIHGRMPEEVAGTVVYSFDVDVTDGTTTLTRSFTMTNAESTPVWSTVAGSLGSFPEGTVISIQLAATDVDSDTLTYTATDGALPGGVTLSSAGLISGTIGGVGSDTDYTFSVQVGDGFVESDVREFTINVTNIASGYTTAAVRFAADAFLSRGGLLTGVVDSPRAIFSCWLRTTASTLGDSYMPYATSPNFFSDQRFFVVASANPHGTAPDVGFNDATFDNSLNYTIDNTAVTPSDGDWHHVIHTCNVADSDPAAWVFQFVFDGVVQAPINIVKTGVGFDVKWTDDDFQINANEASGAPSDVIVEYADIWIGLGQYLDVSVPGNLAKWRDPVTGKPVSLGADGSLPTGVAPTCFLRRAPSAAASTFATNLGPGGNFTITGALTAASTSPTD